MCIRDSILYMANAGAIEMNPWNSTIHNPDNPDWCLIDLDPSDKQNFDIVIRVAQATREVLDNMGVIGYPKTSGSTGIHVYIPVSYTHLRAHETPEHFVCRLLLEKKKFIIF